jgi:RecA-family ATPase
LSKLDVPSREPILGEWFREGDLGLIYGPRGLGKTWLAMYLGLQCAEGGQAATWTVHKPRPVLYLDGEMPLDGIRERDTALAKATWQLRQKRQA